MRNKLTENELGTALEDLSGWEVKDEKLHKTFQFKDFQEAWGFMNRAALDIHAIDHHPEWFNVWSKVVVDLTTHSAGGITPLDVKLANILDKLAE